MSHHWVSWMIVEKKIYLNIMCFELPRNLEIKSLQRQALPFWMDFIVRVVHNEIMWACCNYSLGRRSACDLVFHWDITQDTEWTKCTWGKYYTVHHSVICVANYLSNLGYCAFPHEWNCGKFFINHHMKLRWYINSCWIYNQSYWYCIKWLLNNIYPWTWAGLPTG